MSGLPRSPHALVTGGGRGIGRAIAAELARAGAIVTVVGRQRATLDDAVAAGEAHFAEVADVAEQTSIVATIAKAAARQPIDILVANAGIAESAPFAKSDAALFQRIAHFMECNQRKGRHPLFLFVAEGLIEGLPRIREFS